MFKLYAVILVIVIILENDPLLDITYILNSVSSRCFGGNWFDFQLA